MPKVLLLGATGGCGSPALIKLLSKRAAVTAIVRSADRLPAEARGHELLTVVVLPDGHLVLSDTEMAEHMRGCDAVISSLGHNLTLWGMYGTPRKLCTDTVRQLCRVAELLQPMNPIRLIAISTEGVDRPDGADPPRGRGERLVLWLLWLLLPPHADNLGVVDYLHRSARTSPHVEFCAVRPSDMIDHDGMSAVTLHATLQNGIFSAHPPSTRANVGAFMAALATEASTWQRWKNSFPHILDVNENRKAE